MKTFELSDRSKERMNGVHPYFHLMVPLALRLTPIDFGIPQDGGLRTARRQREMFEDPTIKTKCDGYKNVSEHQAKEDGYGHALDFYAYINGKASWQDHHLAMVYTALNSALVILKDRGQIPNNVNLVWGGSFGSKILDGWDKPHCQLEIL